MRLLDIALLYLLAGGACALALYRRAPKKDAAALAGALVAVPLWPLWAPIAWTTRRDSAELAASSTEPVQRIRAALDEGVESVLGTSLARLLNRESANSIVKEVERVAARHRELLGLLSREEFSLELAEHRVLLLTRQEATARVRASARLHLENVKRLHELAERDERALEELSGLVAALRTQLLLVRLSGSSAEGVGDIVSELWARVESLSEASDEAFGQKVPLSQGPDSSVLL